MTWPKVINTNPESHLQLVEPPTAMATIMGLVGTINFILWEAGHFIRDIQMNLYLLGS